MAVVAYMDGVEKGKKLMREQMMKEAIGVDVYYLSGEGTIFNPHVLPDSIKSGDKVKVIVLNED